MVIDQPNDALLAVRSISQGGDHLFVLIVVHQTDGEQLAFRIWYGRSGMLIEKWRDFQP